MQLAVGFLILLECILTQLQSWIFLRRLSFGHPTQSLLRYLAFGLLCLCLLSSSGGKGRKASQTCLHYRRVVVNWRRWRRLGNRWRLGNIPGLGKMVRLLLLIGRVGFVGHALSM